MYARDTARIATPVGVIEICGDDAVVTAIAIGGDTAMVGGSTAPVRAAAEQMLEWFAGARTVFELPLAAAVTPRGQALRDAMVAISYGETLSYGTLAAMANSSARAIGQACARNPFPIVVPCHRVLNASGSLGTYSAGAGPATKRWLLEFEQRDGGVCYCSKKGMAKPMPSAGRKGARRPSRCESGGSMPPAAFGY